MVVTSFHLGHGFFLSMRKLYTQYSVKRASLSHGLLLFLASGFVGKDQPNKFWQPQSSGFIGSTSRDKKNDGSTHTTNVSEYKATEKKHQYIKGNLDMEKSIIIRKTASKKVFGTKKPRVNGDALKPGGTLAII